MRETDTNIHTYYLRAEPGFRQVSRIFCISAPCLLEPEQGRPLSKVGQGIPKKDISLLSHYVLREEKREDLLEGFFVIATMRA